MKGKNRQSSSTSQDREAVLKAINCSVAAVTGHRSGCMCRKCAQVRVHAKRYARLSGAL